jgi:glycosyltransferase involved in cell wall biosynthesis
LRILHIDTGMKWRGGQQQVWWLLEGLQRAGSEQTLVVPAGSELARRAVALEQASPAVKLVHLNRTGQAEGRVLSFENARIVRGAAQGCDVVHAHDAHAHTLAWGAQKMARGAFPPVAVARRVTFSIPWLGRLKNRQPVWFIAVSEYVRRILVDSGVPAAMMRVVHDGVRAPEAAISRDQRTAAREAFRLAASQFAPGTLSSLAPEKMLEETLRWFATLPDNCSYLLGVPESQAAGEPAAALLRLAAELGCAGRVQVVSVGASATPLLAALDVFTYFSKSEGLGSAILLAMAHGLPVVASHTGGIPEIVAHGQTGTLIDTTQPGWQAAARDAVLTLEADPVKRNRFGTQARAFAASECGSDNMVARTTAIYREILAARAAGNKQTHT